MLMHCQYHLATVKSSSCSSVDTTELPLRYVTLYSAHEVLANDTWANSLD